MKIKRTIVVEYDADDTRFNKEMFNLTADLEDRGYLTEMRIDEVDGEIKTDAEEPDDD